ncbi:hypothetical protein [Kitasatospora sp. NPDC059571]|uniref:hypothetical protein n=1 Tax=Kitasatospora sp. NPDC059571 TaxID=3346871 RepID=UPI00368F6678
MRQRTLAAAVLLTGLTVLGTAGPAAAHGDTIAFAVTSRIDGHLRAVATWENDHDPVTETIAATLSATADDGRTVGPWPLVPVPGEQSTLTTTTPLPPGHWKVTVESGFPALGRAQADLTVTAVPGTAPSAGPTAPSAAPSTRAPEPVAVTARSETVRTAAAGDGAGTWWLSAGAAAAAISALAAATVVLRRRRTR